MLYCPLPYPTARPFTFRPSPFTLHPPPFTGPLCIRDLPYVHSFQPLSIAALPVYHLLYKHSSPSFLPHIAPDRRQQMEGAGGSPSASNAQSTLHPTPFLHEHHPGTPAQPQEPFTHRRSASSASRRHMSQSPMPPPATTAGPSASPRCSSPLLAQSAQPSASAAPEPRRELPSKDVTDDNIDDIYAHFILYCNPHFPSNVDTTELKRIFRKPPTSDGKDFKIFTLWQLIQKFDSKEIKTWTQLALDLGVEPASAEKGGSVQKVQQYSVRLKVAPSISSVWSCH